MSKITSLALNLGAAIFLASCSHDDSSTSNFDGQGTPPVNRVEWSKIAPDFDPQIDTQKFTTDGAERIDLDLFGFKDDVSVRFTPDLTDGNGILKIYTVFKYDPDFSSASFGSLSKQSGDKTFKLSKNGTYMCSIQITNGQIAKLKGGCIVRVEVQLPKAAQIEVYNQDVLLTKRFFPMANSKFIESLEKSSLDDDRLQVIQGFLSSYSGVSKTPSITSEEMGKILKAFSFPENKFKALQSLHSFVSDQPNLGKVVDDQFSYFDRARAHQIIGF